MFNNENNHLNKIKQLNYIPVGLGEDIIARFLRDNIGENISKKILSMENILSIIGYGRIILMELMTMDWFLPI